MTAKLQKPNIVFINTDQQRYDSLACYGNPVAKTPNIDRLAEEGVSFHSCYTSNPVCMPARASWFTGQYPSHNGCWMNGVPLDRNADLVQNRLKDAGYATALIGKIHLDNVWLRTEPHPKYGFDLLIECEGDPYCKDTYFQWLDDQDLFDDYMEQFKAGGHKDGYTRRIPEDKHMNNWIAGHVEDYFNDRQQDGKPFFLVVGFFDPHHPFDLCEPYASRFKPDDMPLPTYVEGEEEQMPPPSRKRFDNSCDITLDAPRIRRTIAAHHATINHVDAMVGRIMNALEHSGLEKNSVVIFNSDHGEMLGDHGIIHKGPVFYEQALHVPLIYRFPRHLEVRGEDHGFTSHVDLAATIASLCDAKPPQCHQGRPLFDTDLQLRPVPARDAALTEWRDRHHEAAPDKPFETARVLRTADWTYVYYHGRDYGELYDRKNDPGEHKNLWTDPEHQSTRRELHDRLLDFLIANEPLPKRTDCF